MHTYWSTKNILKRLKFDILEYSVIATIIHQNNFEKSFLLYFSVRVLHSQECSLEWFEINLKFVYVVQVQFYVYHTCHGIPSPWPNLMFIFISFLFYISLYLYKLYAVKPMKERRRSIAQWHSFQIDIESYMEKVNISVGRIYELNQWEPWARIESTYLMSFVFICSAAFFNFLV